MTLLDRVGDLQTIEADRKQMAEAWLLITPLGQN